MYFKCEIIYLREWEILCIFCIFLRQLVMKCPRVKYRWSAASWSVSWRVSIKEHNDNTFGYFFIVILDICKINLKMQKWQEDLWSFILDANVSPSMKHTGNYFACKFLCTIEHRGFDTGQVSKKYVCLHSIQQMKHL